jgi:hypothetical protein
MTRDDADRQDRQEWVGDLTSHRNGDLDSDGQDDRIQDNEFAESIDQPATTRQTTADRAWYPRTSAESCPVRRGIGIAERRP